jgi:hypothetical protein
MNPYFVHHSDMSVEKYHSFSDATMETLLESLEELLDGLGNPSYEVEYHVRASIDFSSVLLTDSNIA